MIRFGLSPEIAQRFAGSLLHFIWQGAVVAFFSAVVLKLLSRRSAEIRYVISTLALAVMLASPVFTFLFYGQTGAIALKLLQWASAAGASFGSSSAVSSNASAWTRWILLTWSAGVLVLLARLVTGWYLSRRIVRTSNGIVPESIRLLFDDIYTRLALTRPVRILIQAHIDSPIVVGWLRPAILLPVSAITGLSEEQLRGIFAHELAHIRRHDFLVNMLQRCVEAVLFYHPAVWWLSNRIRTEREDCCDDLAVKLCGSRRNYAEALVALEQKRQDRQALAVAATDGSLVHRIQRILGLESSTADWQSAAVTLLFLGVWIITGMWQSTTLVARPLTPVSAALPVVALAAPVPAPVSSALSSIAAIITAQPAPVEPTQATSSDGNGAVQGIVTRKGTSTPVSDVHVVLTTSGAPTPKAVQDFVSYFASRGVTVTPPENGPVDPKFIQQVLDAAAKRGVSRVDPAVSSAVRQLQFSGRKNIAVSTDSAGRFRVDNLPSGKYSLDGGRDDYFDPNGAEVVVVAGKTADVSLSMIPGAIVSGRVSNPSGRPMANAVVTAYELSFEFGLPILRTAEQATTDDRGDYRIFWLPPGEYYIAATPRSTLPARTASNIVAMSRVDQIVRTYHPGVVDALTSKALQIKGGEHFSGIDIAMKAHGGVRRISGVLNSSVQAGTAFLALVPGDSNTPYEAWVNQNLHVGAIPLAANGGNAISTPFDIDGITPGLYRLIAIVDEANPDGGSGYAFGHAAVEVRDRDVSDIHLNVVPTVRVNGTVTIDGHNPGKTSVKVSVQADDALIRIPVYQGLAARAVAANEQDGSFMIPSVGVGHYRLQIANGLPPDLYISDVRQGGKSIFDSGFEVTSEPLGTFEVALRSGAGTAQGTAVDAAGKPLADATVVLVPLFHRENRSLYRTAVSDAAGNFKITGVAPGEYKLFGWERITNGAYFNARFLDPYESRGKVINVVPLSAQASTVTVISVGQ